jgi:ATP-binding cassette subfamily F protein 3
LGENVILGYYAQHQTDNLDPDSTIFNEIASVTSNDRFSIIRDVLGLFGFSGEDINKRVRVLSGGEKARLSLAKILISSANFLIMDEPLNHLDRTAKETLEKALIDYEGTLILISHDRYFLDKIVEKVIEIKDGNCEEYHGNYSYYLEKREGVENSNEIKTIDTGSETSRKERKKIEAEKRQMISAERNRLKKEIEEYEKRIDSLEKKKKIIELTMANPETYEDKNLIVRLQKDLSDINKKLPVLYESWEENQISLKELLDQVKN